ncbi:MAG: serine/threonine protein kinase [Flavobacteriales bacterium]|jgi:serine/threonine protein kinase
MPPINDPDATVLSKKVDVKVDVKAVQTETLGVGDCLKQRFILEEEIGRGGMGIVYRALDLRKQETEDKEPYIAIKLISSSLKALPESLIALQREAKKSQKLAHPNVATVYDFDRDGEEAFLCMELLEGESLADFLLKHPNGIPFEQALPLIRDMARGLGYAHNQHIVHSDFKPGNVFITKEGRAKILDLGIARAYQVEKINNDQTVFDPSHWDAITPAYASLEMFKHADPDPRDDIYALGCVCYQLLCGKHPYDRTPAIRVKDSQLSPPPLKNINRKINHLFQQSISINRAERVANIPEFMAGLQPRAKDGKRRWVALAGVILAIVAASFAWYQSSRVTIREVASAQGDPWLSKASAISPEVQSRIDKLLEVGELHFAMGRYIEPPTSNAAEAYMAALLLQPGNSHAISGANLVVERVSAAYMALIEQNQYIEAQALLKTASLALPGQQQLQKLVEREGK